MAISTIESPKEGEKEMESLFEQNLKKVCAEPYNPVNNMSGSDDEDDRIIIKSKQESEYTKRFIDYGNDQFDQVLRQSTEAL